MTQPDLPVLPGQAAKLDQEQAWERSTQNGTPPHTLSTQALRLRGQLDVGALEEALTRLCWRQSALRASFRSHHGDWVQSVVEDVRPRLITVDLSGRADAEPRLRGLLEQEAARGFAAAEVPRLHALLVMVSEAEHVLAITVDRLVFDGWFSRRVLNADLSHYYNSARSGSPGDLPPLEADYPSFLRGQAEQLTGQAMQDHYAYWDKTLAACGPWPALRIPGKRLSLSGSWSEAAECSVTLTPELSTLVRTAARRLRVSPFMFFLTSLVLTQRDYSGQDQVALVTSVSNRPDQALLATVAPMSNLMTLTVDLAQADSFAEAARTVRSGMFAGMRHSAVPHELIAERLTSAQNFGPERETSIVATGFQDSERSLSLDGLDAEAEPIGLQRVANASFWSVERDDFFELVLDYPIEAMATQDAERLMADVLARARSAAESP